MGILKPLVLVFALVVASPWGQTGDAKDKPTFETFPVRMKVDFGVAGKPAYDAELLVEKDTTPKEAVSQVFPIRSGYVCCSLRDVYAIDGVAVDASQKKWWICLLNGSKNVAPGLKKLKRGDRVEWKYIQETYSA